MLTLDVTAYDVSGQKRGDASNIGGETTVEEMVNALVPAMGLPTHDAEGQQIHYQALFEKEGRYLHNSEKVAEILQPGDEVVLHPNIDAGAR